MEKFRSRWRRSIRSRVGQAKIEDVDVGIVDLDHISKTIGAKIDGDIGYNFLKHFRVTIDYQTGEIRFDESEADREFRKVIQD